MNIERASARTAGLSDPVGTLRRDGIALARDVIDPDTVIRLLADVTTARAAPGRYHRRLSADGEPAMDSELFRWRDLPALRALVTGSALTALACSFFATDATILLEDQWFWSSAGSETPSPWHQDEPYHPLSEPFVTVWLPLTPVPGDAGIRGVAGSHLGPIYAPVEFSAGDATLDTGSDALQPVPDVDADPRSRVVVPDARPGDAVLLDSRTLHAAGGRCTTDFVRLSIRYAHPSSTFSARPWGVASFWADHLTTSGSRLASPAFPLLPDGRAA